MDLSLSSDQEALRASARSLLREKAPVDDVAIVSQSVSGYDEDLHAMLISLGWASLGLTDEDSSLIDLGVVLTELGYHATPSPLSMSVCAGLILKMAGSPTHALIVQVAAGRNVAIVNEPQLATQTCGRQSLLTGDAVGVEWAEAAATYLVITGSLQKHIWIVDRDQSVSVHRQESMDNVRLGRVSFDQSPADGPITVSASQWREIHHLVRLIRAVDLLGITERVTEMATSHVKEREQFRRPLAMFQAVQHHLSNMAIKANGSRTMIYHALWRYSVGLPYERHAAMAAWFAGEATVDATQMSNQLHGGIGFMKEFHLHHFFHRAIAQRSRMGTESERLCDLGDVVIEAAQRDYHQEFAEWPVQNEHAFA